jgi:diguanylate cyclase (GGDEF)-like protein
MMRELAQDTLSERVALECVSNAHEALAALAREPADLVVSDLEMPGLSGLDLLERVRQEHPQLAFVLLTAHASVESAIRALRMGAADYLHKPIEPDELRWVVERVLAHRRLLRDNDRLRSHLETIQACQPLLHCVDAGEVYALSLERVLRATHRDRGFTVFRRASLPGADGVAFRGFSEMEARALRSLLVEEKPEVALAPLTEPQRFQTPPFHEALRELDIPGGPAIAVPLRGADREEGVTWVFAGDRPFSAEDLDRAALVAGYTTLALANAERYADAKERAFVDDVTDAYNVRYLLEATENEIQRAERYGKALTVLFLDLDRFKLVNDRHGHLVGSRVLRRLSEVLGECVRQVDTLARYGGDEFTILLVDTDHDTGLKVAERIRRTVADTIFEGEGGAPIRLTISIGVATYPGHSREREGLLDLADKAMYRAKSRGRNCISSADELA